MLFRPIYHLKLLFIISFFIATLPAKATITCGMSDNGVLQTYTNTLNATVSTGADTPVGTVLYFATLNGGWADSFGCGNDAWSLTMKYKAYDSGDSLRLSSSPYPPGDYYPTNVPGIGYMFIAKSAQNVKNTFTGPTPFTDGTWGGGANSSRNYRMYMYVALIKTAPGTVSGNVNVGAFHWAKYYAPPTPGYQFKSGAGNDGDGFALGVFKFSGSIIVQAPTCQLGDKNVSVGDHLLSAEMKTVGGTTSWYDASIEMKNCSGFAGYYSSDTNGQSVTGSGTASGGTRQSNLFSVSVSPVSTATSEGYISLTDSEGKTVNSAKGYALQLGYTPDNLNASISQPSNIWKPGAIWQVSVPPNSSGTIRIPLSARLIRTSQNISPGLTNAKVIVSVSYK